MGLFGKSKEELERENKMLRELLAKQPAQIPLLPLKRSRYCINAAIVDISQSAMQQMVLRELVIALNTRKVGVRAYIAG